MDIVFKRKKYFMDIRTSYKWDLECVYSAFGDLSKCVDIYISTEVLFWFRQCVNERLLFNFDTFSACVSLLYRRNLAPSLHGFPVK